jgi:hypothetical protein
VADLGVDVDVGIESSKLLVLVLLDSVVVLHMHMSQGLRPQVALWQLRAQQSQNHFARGYDQ